MSRMKAPYLRHLSVPATAPMTLLITLLFTILLLGACSDERAEGNLATNEEQRRFLDFLTENYALDMQQRPATASNRGINTNAGAWNSDSEDFRVLLRAQAEARLARLAEFDRDKLSESQDLSWQLYQQVQQRFIAGDEFRHHDYVVSQFSGVHSYVPSFLGNTHLINNTVDAENYIARLNAVSELFDQTIEQMRLSEAIGVFLPRWSYPQMIQTARNSILGHPFDEDNDASVLWNDFSTKVAALKLPEAAEQKLLAAARQALLEQVQPAYARLIAEFERLRGLAPAGDGVWKHPDGEAYYAQLLRYYTTTDLGPDEVHDIGLREVARIHEEMQAIMAQVEFTGDLHKFMRFMRDDPRFYYDSTPVGRERYLNEASAYIATMRENLPRAFGRLPKAEVEVWRVEPFRERTAGRAFYRTPPPDGSRPGIYYANLYDMASMPTYQMEALAYHEGIPGHHMQLAIAVELDTVPEFQKYARFTAYTEGWGLYAEFLPKEMGFYEDPYSDFGRLAMELWRACRLVVDTGLHDKRWTKKQAIDYLVENTPNSVYDSTKAIERYAVLPGQATAYLIGKLKIVELRERARAALGDELFDLAAFHDEVLKDGPVPLQILDAKIARWTAGRTP